jgi:hypothetical protein
MRDARRRLSLRSVFAELFDRVALAIYVLTVCVLLTLAVQIWSPLGPVEFAIGLVLAVPIAIALTRAWKARFGS